MGMSAQQWLLSERLILTQRLLEITDEPIEHIAELAGFRSAVSLRQYFKTTFRVAPSVWRQTFAGP